MRKYLTRNSGRSRYTINESQLARIVTETVKRVLNESEDGINQQIEAMFKKYDKAVDILISEISENENFIKYETLNHNMPHNRLAGFLKGICADAVNKDVELASYDIMEGGFDYDKEGNLTLVDTDFFKHNLNRALMLLTAIEQYFSERGGYLSRCINSGRIKRLAGYCISYLVKIANIAGLGDMLSDGENNANSLPVGEYTPDWYKTMRDLPDYYQ